MLDIQYSETRGTWNLFYNGEWYLEGTYEQCQDAANNLMMCDEDEEYEEDEYDFEITEADLHDYMYGI